mmetsp:Transcript_5889/g.15311  ORF Transcript_5889/g.15311 Transcript_5889/m.15311 type:complete len:121 (+) Transcript_5889:1092-1454(+)
MCAVCLPAPLPVHIHTCALCQVPPPTLGAPFPGCHVCVYCASNLARSPAAGSSDVGALVVERLWTTSTEGGAVANDVVRRSRRRCTAASFFLLLLAQDGTRGDHRMIRARSSGVCRRRRR